MRYVLLLLPTVAFAQPAPSTEVATYLKTNAGTWSCTGSIWMPDHKAYQVTATLVIESYLADFWDHETFTGKIALGAFTLEMFATHDGSGWHQFILSSIGGYASGSLTELVGSDPFGKYSLRTKQSIDNTGLKRSAERSLDGKTWVHDYDVTCKR